MKIQVHKESGLSIRDGQSNELLYQDSFENAGLDADLEQLSWPDQNIIRIFSLRDGRIAVVRETAEDLQQQAADGASEALLLGFGQQLANLQANQAERLAAQETPIDEEL